MRKLAIIGCKAIKKQYKCSAEEMYSDAPTFKSQIPFIKEYYTDYMILSVKYGIITRDTIIEPYNLTIAPPGTFLKSHNPTINEESKQRWITKVIKQIAQLSFKWDEIHLHIPESYLDPISEVLQIPNIHHIKFPSFMEIKPNYGKALEIYKEKDDVSLEVITSYVKWRKAFKYELLNKKIVLPWIL